MLKPSYPYYLAGKPVAANEDLVVTDKYAGEVATRVAVADAKAIDAGIAAAAQAAEPMRKLPRYEHCWLLVTQKTRQLLSAP